VVRFALVVSILRGSCAGTRFPVSDPLPCGACMMRVHHPPEDLEPGWVWQMVWEVHLACSWRAIMQNKEDLFLRCLPVGHLCVLALNPDENQCRCFCHLRQWCLKFCLTVLGNLWKVCTRR